MGYLYGANTYGSGLFGIDYAALAGLMSVSVAFSATGIQLWKPLVGNMTITVGFSGNIEATYALVGNITVTLDFSAALSAGALWQPETPEDDGWTPDAPEQGVWVPITPTAWN